MKYYLIKGGFSLDPVTFVDAGIGTWDGSNRTAVLTQDISHTIVILIDNVTLTGLKPDDTAPVISNTGEDGIFISGRDKITVTNLELVNNKNGIYVDQSSNIIIRCNIIRDNINGINFNINNDSNTISDNNIYENYEYGINFFENNNFNTINNNKICNNGHGIYLSLFNNSNIIICNDISYNCRSQTGLYLDGDNNLIKYNNFINNNPNAINNGKNNEFYGNYWSDWDGCGPYTCNCVVDCHPSKCPVCCKKPSFKQFSIEEYLTIPEQKPCARDILNCTVAVEIIDVSIIRTPKGISKEGQALTGYAAAVSGHLLQCLEYVADMPDQGIHAAHFTYPFSTNIILDNSYDICDKLHITHVVEDVYYMLLDKRSIFKNVTLYLEAKTGAP